MNRQVAARKIQEIFRRKLIYTNNQGLYKLSKSVITAQIVSFKLPTNWRAVFDSTPKGFSEIIGYKTKTPVVRWTDGRWIGDSTGVNKMVAKYRAVTIVFSDSGFDVLGAGNYEQALLAIVKSGWAPKLLLKAPPVYKKIDGMFHVNRHFDLKEFARALHVLPESMRASVTSHDKANKYGIPAVILKLKKPKWTYQFFENGTVLFSGIKDPKDVELPKELFKQILSPAYGVAPMFAFDTTKRAMLTRPRRRATNATGRLAERHKLAGTWNRLRPAPEGYYIRPGTDGKPRYYPWILFETRGGANYGPFGSEIVKTQVPIRQLNLKAVAPKVLDAFKKAGKPIPPATAKVFANAGYPLEESEEENERPKETALKNRRAPSWNATRPGFYVRPGPGKQPYWFRVPEGLASGRKTVIKTYTDAGRNIPRAVRNIFKIGNNVKTESDIKRHVVKMGLNGILRINNRQATRLTKAELLAIARNLNIARATSKMTPDALISLIQYASGAHKPNRSYDVFVNGMYYTLLNNGRVARTTQNGIQTQRAWGTLGADERNKIARALLPAEHRAEYNAMPIANRFNTLRAMANMNRKTKAAAAAAEEKEVAKGKARAEENAEAEKLALELEFALRLAQNLGNLYKNGNEHAFLVEYGKLPSGSRGKPLKATVEKAYKLFIKNLKTQRSDAALRNAFRETISVPNWLPATKVGAYKNLLTNLAFQKPKPKVANFRTAVKAWLNREVPQSPARAAKQVENAITGQKRIIPAYVPKKRPSPVLPKLPTAAAKKSPKEPKARYAVYSPASLNFISNTMNRYKLNYRRQKGWTVQEFVNAVKKKNKGANANALRAMWNAEVTQKAASKGAVGRIKR
jgi:hypothetical protein